MTSFLDPSQLRAKIAAVFKGKLLTGTLTRVISSGTDQYGDPVPGVPQTFSVQGCVDEFSAIYRAQAGIPENSVNIILIAGLCKTTPLKDDKITFPNFATFQVRKVKGDPALAHWELESFS